jgi:hypothetical protein
VAPQQPPAGKNDPGRSIYGGVIVDAMFQKQIRDALVFAQRI